MNIVSEIANGFAVIKDWLGEEMIPVGDPQAVQRAQVCLLGDGGKECPHHMSPKWWEGSKTAIAAAIKIQMAAKNGDGFNTALDDDLKMCRACGCAMPLKIWVPIKHIKAHTTPETLEKFPAYCWQRKEMEQTNG